MDGQRIRNLIGIAAFGRSIRVNDDGVAADLYHSRIVAEQRYEQIDRNIRGVVLDDRRRTERKRCAHTGHAIYCSANEVGVIANVQVRLHLTVIDVDGAVSVPRYLKAERFADSAYRSHCAAIYGNRLQGRGLTLDNNLHLCLLTLCIRRRRNDHRLIVCRHSRCCHRTGYCQCHHHRNRLFHKNLPFIACVFLPFAIDTIENRKMLQPLQKIFLCLTQHFCYIKCI
ncbi:Uncharacterised protein [uncultured Butyricicoccus sp.]|nr:Uncharacterised protein [uncultured Butyricicoccus sp.]